MKRRTYWVILLLYVVTLGLFWWMWQNPAPANLAASSAFTHRPSVPVAASTNAKKIALTFVPVSTPAMDAADTANAAKPSVEVVEATPAAPAQADPPVQHSAVISVPLAQAERLLLSRNQDLSIMGVFDRPNSSDKVVDVYVWDNGNGRGGYIRSSLLSGYGGYVSEDQKYITSWEQQQQAAAASNSTTPYLIATPPPNPNNPWGDLLSFNSENKAYINCVAQQVQAAAASNSTTPELTPDTPSIVRVAIEIGGNVLNELNQRVQNGESVAQVQAWLNAMAQAAATPSQQPQSATEPTALEPASPSAPQQGPNINTSPQN